VDSASLSLEKAIPCGLIINELITNVFKHAFPRGEQGEIKLAFKESDGKHILVVSDNGVGLPSSMDAQNMVSLGMQLIRNLTRQIGGDLVLGNKQGTTFTITF
jgi:two-component sensor histidine kinase